jgi:hypothetical protein
MLNRQERQRYPTRHISLRVPWHDNEWNGGVCNAPTFNEACLKLRNIAAKRDDDAERSAHGQLFKDIDHNEWSCCIRERAAFMSAFAFDFVIQHPYVQSNPATHGHFAPTTLRHPAYSAPAVPFFWMQQPAPSPAV